MQVNRESLEFFSALASETRLRIIELLGEGSLNIRELAERLQLSSTIVARHINALEAVGIVRCQNITGARGLQRQCSLAMQGSVLDFRPEHKLGSSVTLEMPVGQYSGWNVQPTCGLSTEKSIIGEVDDPRFFVDPMRAQAGIIWVGRGYLEYMVPNYMTSHQRISAISFQMEICSEAPGFNNQYPSDIYFSINGRPLGYWTCPGDFGDRKGLLTPDWWLYGTEYGMLKTLSVNDKGCYVDGMRLSDITVDQLGLQYAAPIRFTVASPKEAFNPGGFVLFGKSFGNYNQDIVVTMEYQEKGEDA